jgi:hypothetical protein
MTETIGGNESNGTEQPRRARSSTERSRAHRAKKKLERDAALKAEAERVAEAVAGVPGDVASTENAVASAAPRPTEPKVEREAAALHEAGKAEREADATETATIERVAGRVADVADTVAPENAVSSLPAVNVAGVPAVSTPVEWRIVERPVWRPTMLSLDAQPPAHPVHPARRALASILAAITPASISVAALVLTLGLVVLAFVGAGLVMNARYAASLGHTDEAATVQAVIGIGVDVLALVLLSVGWALWSRGHPALAVIAWFVWPVMVGFSLMGITGFFATNISDALAERSAAVIKASAAATKASHKADDIQDWRNERKTITEKRTVEELKLQLARDRRMVDRIDRDAFEVTFGCTRPTVDTMKACAPILPVLQALETARRRDDLTKKISDAEKPKESTTTTADGNQQSTATMTSVDPQAEMVPKLITWISRGWIKPSSDDIAMMRILWSMVPGLAGVVLMLVMGLLAPPRAT